MTTKVGTNWMKLKQRLCSNNNARHSTFREKQETQKSPGLNEQSSKNNTGSERSVILYL